MPRTAVAGRGWRPCLSRATFSAKKLLDQPLHNKLAVYAAVPHGEAGLCVQNELATLEFIHCLVETLDRYFSNVCELDLMFNLEMVRHPLLLQQACYLPPSCVASVAVFHLMPASTTLAGAFHCG